MQGNSDIYVDFTHFKLGLSALDDTAQSPFGTARIMNNVYVTDKGSVAPRPGTQLLGTSNASTKPTRGLFNFRRSFSQDEILIKAYDTVLEVYSKDNADLGWNQLMKGLTSDQVFGFVTSLVNTDNQDYVLGGNRTEPFFRWRGAIARTTSVLAGGETTITLDNTLKPDVYDAKTATFSSSTSLDISSASLVNGYFNTITATSSSSSTLGVSGTPWTANEWNGMYVYITSGPLTGKLSLISSTTTNSIGFDDLGSDPGTCTFEICTINAPWAPSQWNNFYVHILSGSLTGKVAQIVSTSEIEIGFNDLGGNPGACNFEIRDTIFPSSGSVYYNNQSIFYSEILSDTQLLVTSAVAAPSGTMVTVVPDLYPQNPQGNRFANYLNRVIVGNVRSALARGSGGALQGYASAGSYFVSNVNNPFDFTYSQPRVAGQGDLIATPYGGGDITDVITQEDGAYIFKPRYVESVAYSQDVNDLAVRTPLKSGIGSVGKVIKGADDVYFMTWDNRFVSLGRVKTKDLKPATENIGEPIKRILEACGFGDGSGIEYKSRLYIPCKSDPTLSANDQIIIFNLLNQSFEGIWTISANDMEEMGGNLYFGDSTSANVYQMLTGTSDIVGGTRFPIAAQFATHFLSLATIYPSTRRIRRSYAQTQQLQSLFFEGYINGDSTVTFEAWKDFAAAPFLQFDFNGLADAAFLDGGTIDATLGGQSIGLHPMGSISSPDENGYRHFEFRVFFPFQYAHYYSIGFESSELDTDYQILRMGMQIKEVLTYNAGEVKQL